MGQALDRGERVLKIVRDRGRKLPIGTVGPLELGYRPVARRAVVEPPIQGSIR